MSAQTRELLAQTGVLQTREDEPGHISNLWRRQIIALCDQLDSAPLGIAERLRAECERHGQTREALAECEASVVALHHELAEKTADMARASEKLTAAVRLVEEAEPRMRTLNNALTPDWLARAAFLGA